MVQDVSIHRARIRACTLSDTILRDFNLSTKFLFINVDFFLHVDKFEKPLHFSRSRDFSMYCLIRWLFFGKNVKILTVLYNRQ